MAFGMAMQADPARLGPTHCGLARPVLHNLCGLQSLARLAHHLAAGS